MDIKQFHRLLQKSWDIQTYYLNLQQDVRMENLSQEQSLLTALIVNNYFGGKIMKCVTPSGSHYYNLINNEIVDMTVNQCLGETLIYEKTSEVNRDILLNNIDTKNNYEKLLYHLKQNIRQFQGIKFKLIDSNGQPYLSDTPGKLGGYKKMKIYGKLDCPSAQKWIEKGHYIQHRVFFENEETAIAAGYRPCAKCMPDEYKQWKNQEVQKKLTLDKKA